ncbi:hypothetical protein [Holophaga foetida]|uniref:hypothetical protein n=1 Tax=Holophaga foetida TaxID=35839 RepID=UPI0002471C21|nr:hypothetical protein [Holophaga foetida]
MKRSLIVKDHLEEKLKDSGLVDPVSENFTKAINTALERYFKACERARPRLTIGQWETIKQSLIQESNANDESLEVPFLTDPRQLVSLVEGFLLTDDYHDLKRKQEVDGLDLRDKLSRMSYLELLTVLQAMEAEHAMRLRWTNRIIEEVKQNAENQELVGRFSEEYQKVQNALLWPDVVGWECCGVDPGPDEIVIEAVPSPTISDLSE